MRAAAYLINLDRSPERLAHMQAQAATVGLQFERVPAVDGEALSEAELDRYRLAAAPRPLTAGEIGCWLSHQAFWRLAATADALWSMVLEDDVALSPNLPAALDAAGELPADADIVKIDTTLSVPAELARPSVPFAGRALHRLRRNSWGTAGYLVSRRAAAWLAQHARAVEAPIDVHLFSPRSSLFGALTTYVMDPALVVQEQHLARVQGRADALGSVITERQEARREAGRGVARRVAREIVRVADQARAAFAYRRRIDWR
jgi:glycosyl transferase family 25